MAAAAVPVRPRADENSFEITAADGNVLAIPAGEYYFNTKARAKRMMQNSLSADARRVYAVLELATMGYQQELCVTMERGKQRPLTPADICDQSGLSRQNVRRALAELEEKGLAQRVAADGGSLRQGQILIYSWAIPRTKCKEECSQRRLHFPDWFPEELASLKPLIGHHKLLPILNVVSADYISDHIEEFKAAAQDYQRLENVVEELLKRGCAQPPLNKEERTERTKTKTHTPDESVTPADDGVCVSPPCASVPPEIPLPPPAVPAREVVIRFDPEPAWNVFWNAYPEKKGEEEVHRWWTRQVTSREYACQIIDGLNWHLQSDKWNRGIGIPDPINFLRKHAYKDRPKPQPPPVVTKEEQIRQQTKEFARRMDERIRNGGKV